MRILVTGGDGQLGRSLKEATRDSANEYIFTDVDDIDITDPEAVDLGVKCNDFQAIVNCAAFTDVERAEEQEDIATLINATAPAYLAKAAVECGIPLIHISTDYVFGGDCVSTPLTEDSPVSPIGAYGRTKLLGEQAIQASGCRHLIIRTAWLYSEFGHNFLKTMLRLTAEKPSLNVVFDQTGTPTYARDLAETIAGIIDSGQLADHSGIYHYTDEGVCSWFDFARMIADTAGHLSCDIRPCRSSEFPTRATRPSYSVLDKSKIRRDFSLAIPYWVDSLRRCLAAMAANNQ